MSPPGGPGSSTDRSNHPGPKKRPADGSLPGVSAKKPRTDIIKETRGDSSDNRRGGRQIPKSKQGDQNGRKSQQKTSGNKLGQFNRRTDGVQSTPNSSANASRASSRDPRRPKMQDIRSIAAQHTDAALKDGELDVEAFVNSRSFELKALDESMKRTRAAKTSRAFQKVPFKLRRRSGAHNYKRVPSRLQKKAKKEMQEDNTPLVNSRTRKPGSTRSRLRAETARRLEKLAERKRKRKLVKKGLAEETIQIRMARPKIRRNALNEPLIVAKKFRKRQLNKTWLCTHLWHVKRARMTPPKEPLWRFAVPLTPTQKNYRPTHRAQWEKGAIAWDMSYVSTIGMCGAMSSVQHVLKALGITAERLWSERSKWLSGAVHWNGILTRQSGDSIRTIGPATILWDPEPQVEDETAESTKVKKSQRRLLIRIHPSAFLEVFHELLRLVKGFNPRPFVEDLRYEIGSIEITGPGATEALLGILKPYHDAPESKEPYASAFEKLAGMSGPAVLPSGSLLAFSIRDPRLRYPPQKIRFPDSEDDLLQTIRNWEGFHQKKPYALFDRDARFKGTLLPSQKSITRRRGKNPPGVPLETTQVDPEIPIILLASSKSSTAGSWTLMVPWKCVLPLWYCLMHYPLSTGDNPQFGGLNEIRQLAFEQGAPWFPGDFPATDAGMTWEIEQRQARKQAWDRMPKGKRVNFETLDLGAGRKGEIGDGLSCDFETLLGLDPPSPSTSQESHAENGEQPDVDMADVEATSGAGKKDQKQKQKPPKHPLTALNHVSKAAFNALISSKSNPDALPPHSIITVKVTILGRGVPDPCARIYSLPPPTSSSPLESQSQAIVIPLPSPQAEVPATVPPIPTPAPAPSAQADNSTTSKLPSDLRDQWLSQIPQTSSSRSAGARGGGFKTALKHNSSSATLDLQTRRRLLAQELIAAPPSTFTSAYQPNQETINGHPLCPDAECLIGFVTTGSYNLRTGRAEGIASLSAAKALEEIRKGNEKEARLCVVRNAGENIGWVARWDLV